MEYQMRDVSPIPYPYNYIRFKPAVVPFLFLGRFEMDCMGVNTQIL
jgi:hypothetical protein